LKVDGWGQVPLQACGAQCAVDYLLESRYVTGRILPLDGGRHLQ
jgi:hypothetical protein